jgi:tRNA (cytosine38-C5)-methyltransferase
MLSRTTLTCVETSSTRQLLLSTLKSLNYTTFECLLTPLQFGIPNSRLRYYLLAKTSPQKFSCSQSSDEDMIWRYIPNPASNDSQVDPTYSGYDTISGPEKMRSYLDEETVVADASVAHGIPDRVLSRWGRLFDIVLPSSQRTCCFTRGTHVSPHEAFYKQLPRLYPTRRAHRFDYSDE